MTRQALDLVCVWWNCRLSPPSKKAKKYPMTDGFWLAIRYILDRGVDFLGLCEVDHQHAMALEAYLEKEGLSQYGVISLYSKGRSIDDFCLIYDITKLRKISVLVPANVKDPQTTDWLKAGVFVQFEMGDKSSLYVGLSHWQSRQTYSNESISRLKLGQALRLKVLQILELEPDAHIVLCGDYNDEPYNTSIVEGLGASRDAAFVKKRPYYLFNPFWRCLAAHDPIHPAGTYIHARANKSSGGVVYDQIMFSSKFLAEWEFKETGSIIGDIPISSTGMRWSDISDHYPVLSHLTRGSP